MDIPWVVSEAALAHSLGNSIQHAYVRSDLFECGRTLMQMWADYITGNANASRNGNGELVRA